jgi:TPR repeat protein
MVVVPGGRIAAVGITVGVVAAPSSLECWTRFSTEFGRSSRRLARTRPKHPKKGREQVHPNQIRRRRTGGRSAYLFATMATVIAVTGCNPEAGVARELEAACQAGDASACNDLGWRVRQGQHVLADWRRAKELFQQACEADEGDACVRLARLHIHGAGPRRGIPADSTLAATTFERACEIGAYVGCIDLADMLLARDTADEAGAAGLFERGCDGGEFTACTRLGDMVATGRGATLDTARAMALHRRACDAGSGLGCANLGLAYETGFGVERDFARAATLYEGACEIEMIGCHRLGDLHVRGAGVSEDIDRAVELFREACAGTMRRDRGSPGIAESCFRVADLYANGYGGQGEFFRARIYFRRACQMGYEEGCERS